MAQNAKQVMDIRAGKGFTTAQSREHLRGPSQRGKEYAMSRGNNYNASRERLNFEIVKGGVVAPVDKSKSIPQRIKENLASRGIKDPNEGLETPRFRTIANLIFGGSRDRMRELAFGTQEVDYEHKDADNSSVRREKGIEDWARDVYKFVAKKFGEENIVAFVVHLDESNPHVHCTLLPIKDGKFKFKEIFAGKDKFEFSARMKALHSEFAEVNKAWGMSRGTPIAETNARHRTTEEYRRELTSECNSLESDISQHQGELAQLKMDIRKTLKAKKSLETMIANLLKNKEEKEMLIEKINEQMKAKIGDPEKLKAEVDKLNEELKEIEAKLADKEEKCHKAEQRYLELLKMMEDVKEWARNAESKGLEYANHVTRVYDVIVRDAVLSTLAGEQRDTMKKMNENGYEIFDDTLIESLAENGDRLVQCTINLFIGAVCDATDFAKTHGGGGSSNDHWGRKKDESDREWARRCAMMAKRFLKSSSGRTIRR